MSRGQARLALLFAVIGLGASVWAAYVHYHLLYDPHYTSLCDVNATVSCTTVYQSRFSMFRGVPVAYRQRVFARTADGAIVSLDAGSGRLHWRRPLKNAPGFVSFGPWYRRISSRSASVTYRCPCASNTGLRGVLRPPRPVGPGGGRTGAPGRALASEVDDP